MSELPELLALPVVQRSILALAIAAIGLPVVGVFIVALDIVAVRFAMMHVALLGIAFAFLTNLDPLLCALVLCGLTGAAVAPMANRPTGLSGSMGLVMTFAIAGALLVLSISGVNATSAFELLWGSILATRAIDIAVLGALGLVVHALYWRKRAELTLVLFDRELALCSGVNAGRLVLALLVVVAVAIGAAIRLTGALLVDALTLLPALGARNLGRSLTAMVRWSVVLGLTGNLAGFAIALVLDLPPGPLLVLVAGTLTLITYLIPQGVLDAQVPSRPDARVTLHRAEPAERVRLDGQ
jgi:zinc transport system permease protein